MCGIAGIFTQTEYREQIEKRILPMQAALRHRGPDDRGIYVSEDRSVALAHTRLSILDLSPAGHQPMSISDGRYWITFNGEIYNFKELRRSLEEEGERFQSQTDTEVILKLYQRFGRECVDRLRGMFAFAIWDDLEKNCFISRDPLGIKPLYYWQSGSTLVIASELRAILASGLPSTSLNPDGLYGYLTTGSVPEPDTLIEGIQCLEAGHWLNWRSGNLQKQQYWQIDFTPENISLPEAPEILRQALLDSIEHHFVSDVPVGVFLSGGIDSTALVALARQIQQGELRTYSISFAEEKWNEGNIAQQVAQIFATKHTEYQVTANSAKEILDKYLTAIDQPSIDGFNTFCVSQIASSDGSKVVLSGLGGDELFAGYHSFIKIPKMVCYASRLKRIQPVANTLGIALEKWGNSPKLKRIGAFIRAKPTVANAYNSYRGIFSPAEAIAICSRYFSNLEFEPRDFDDRPANNLSIADRVSTLEIERYMRNQLLRDSDVMSMANGLELRVPLVDRTFLETIAKIPSTMRLATGKQLLIQSVPELPDFVVNRPKKGFSFPFEQWMNREWYEGFSSPHVFDNISLDPWYRRWNLTMLDRWLENVCL
jgi:asparagine synthase (glutamine-hydrolysing)